MAMLLARPRIIAFKATALPPPCPSFIISGNQITEESPIDGATWQRLKCLGGSEGATGLKYPIDRNHSATIG